VALDLHVQGRGHIMLGRIHGDEVLGWSWLLPPYRWSLGAVVAADIEGVQFDAVGVRRLIEEDPEFGRELMTRFLAVTAQRVHTARLRIAELYGYPADPAAPGPQSAG
jgi:CRP/FNR family cyclic AMP-dependent transcriptional regulator